MTPDPLAGHTAADALEAAHREIVRLRAALSSSTCQAGLEGACATCAAAARNLRDPDDCARDGHGATVCLECGQQWTKGARPCS